MRSGWLLDPAVTYLNHGAFGAVPVEVAEAAVAARARVEANPNAFLARELPEHVDRARHLVADLLHADPAGSVFVTNATTGSATVLASLLAAGRLRPGDEVVTTDHCYGAVARQLDRLAASGVEVRVASVPTDVRSVAEVSAAVAGALGERTRLLVVDHIASPTGLVLPVADVVAGAHARGVPVLVDAAHAPMQVAVDLAATGADFWVGNLHKWACCLRALATLVVAEEWRDVVRPLVASHEFPAGFHPAFDWVGTADVVPLLSVPAALAWWSSYGVDRAREEQHRLATDGAEAVAAALGTRVLFADELTAAMRAVELPVPLPAAVARRVERVLSAEHRIEVPLTQLVVPGTAGRPDERPVRWVRLCGQVYNAPEDYERLAEVLPQVLAAAGQ